MDSIEKRVISKVSWRLLPFIGLMYVVNYLDRINVSFAALTMKSDLSFSNEIYGLGAGIFFIGYFFLQVPSNLIIERVGARRWITPIAILWGFISVSMMWVKTPTTFYVLRFILGAAEAGFFPGMILYMTYWFPEKVRSKAVSCFMLGIPMAAIIGGPLSGWIFTKNGMWGLTGWQLIFLLEGLPAVLLGFMVFFYLSDRPEHAHWLTEEEKIWLSEKLKMEAETKGKEENKSPFCALSSSKAWLLSVIHILIATGMYGLTLWIPEIIQNSFNISSDKVSALSAIPYVAAATCMVMLGASSSRTGERNRHYAYSVYTGALGLILCTLNLGPAFNLLSLTIAAMGVLGGLGIFWSLPMYHLTGPLAAGGIALVNCIGNLGGFIGPFLLGLGKQMTNSFSGALIVLAVLLVLTGTLTLITLKE